MNEYSEMQLTYNEKIELAVLVNKEIPELEYMEKNPKEPQWRKNVAREHLFILRPLLKKLNE